MMSQTRYALMVEDDSSWQEVLSEILTDLDLEVTITDNLAAAIEAIRSTPHRIAIVDLSLDESDHRNKDGLKVLEAIRKYDPGCVSLILTGYATVEIAVSALTEYGAMTCLRKEAFVRSEFRRLVREALASSPPESTRAAARRDPATHLASLHDQSIQGTALVIEDDAGWRKLLGELLAEAGYEMYGCNSFGDALGSINRIQFDLAIVDLSLSRRARNGSASSMDQELDGYRLLACTRANGIPTIVVSGVATPDVIEHVYDEFDIYTYLEKQSFDRRIFLQAIEEIARARHFTGDLEHLSDRENQVLSLLATGMTNQEIADTLIISANTVKRHVKAIYRKLNTNNRAAAAAKATKAAAR